MKTLQSQLDKKFDHTWQEFCILYPEINQYSPPKIVINKRFTKTAGNYDTELNVITLASRFFENNADYMFCVILPHECAHAVDYILNGVTDRFHHGKTWKNIMASIGLPSSPYHTMEL